MPTAVDSGQMATSMPVIEQAPTSAVFHSFPARSYLAKYYDAVGPENEALLCAIGGFVRRHPGPTDSIIEVAGGPSLFSLMAVAAQRRKPFDRITFTDIAAQNLEEVEWWLTNNERAFSYDHLNDWITREWGADAGDVASAVRSSGWELAQRDWLLEENTPELEGSYDVVASHFFAESATSDEEEFLTMLRKVRCLGRPGGLLLLSLMSRSPGYRIDDIDFPAFGVDSENIGGYLARAGIEIDPIDIRYVPTEVSSSESGYDGLIFIGGRLG